MESEPIGWIESEGCRTWIHQKAGATRYPLRLAELIARLERGEVLMIEAGALPRAILAARTRGLHLRSRPASISLPAGSASWFLLTPYDRI